MQINLSLLVRAILSTTLIGVACLPGCTSSPPCTVAYLISKINDANSTPLTTDTIDLPAGCIYTLTIANNHVGGSNGLPVIRSPIIINGNGATIQRDADAERFRLFYVSLAEGNLTINDVTLSGGYAYDPGQPNNVTVNSGGAIRNSGQLTVSKTVIRNNRGREGGGIHNFGAMTLSDVTIDSNEDYFGLPASGGLYNEGFANSVITNTTVSHNGFNSFHPANGIYNSGHLEMTNSTISRNAGCGVDNEGELVLNHVTLAFNEGCAVASHGDLYTSNSIFTGGCGNTIHPVFPNLDMDGTCGGMAVLLADLKLGSLADNGGVTQTNALGSGSVAIDLVVRECLPTDQRGVARPQGPKCDVGAYEYVPPPVPVLSVTDTPTSIPAITPTATSERKACIFTAKVNLFCRSGPGASRYPDVDSFTAGQSANVVAKSPDGLFVFVEGPNTGIQCAVSPTAKFGTLAGDCDQLLVFTPPPPPEPTKTKRARPPGPVSQPGCTVRNVTGALTCEVPCPPGAIPGDACTP